MELRSPITESAACIGKQSTMAEVFEYTEKCKANASQNIVDSNADDESSPQPENVNDLVEPQPNEQEDDDDDDDDCVYIGATHYISLISDDEEEEEAETDDEDNPEKSTGSPLKPLSDQQEKDESDGSCEYLTNTESKEDKEDKDDAYKITILENIIITEKAFPNDANKPNDDIETDQREQENNELESEVRSLENEALKTTENEKLKENIISNNSKVLWSQNMTSSEFARNRPSHTLMEELFGNEEVEDDSKVPVDIPFSWSDLSSTSSSNNSSDDENNGNQEKKAKTSGSVEVNEVPDMKKPKMDC